MLCPSGHPLVSANLYQERRGRIRCAVCQRQRNRRAYQSRLARFLENTEQRIYNRALAQLPTPVLKLDPPDSELDRRALAWLLEKGFR
jgi:transposase-like protein